MSADDWKNLAVVLGVLLSVGALWAILVKVMTPVIRDWVRRTWKEDFDKLDTAYTTAIAARDTGEAVMEAVNAQTTALAGAMQALVKAQENAIALGEMRAGMLKMEAQMDEIEKVIVDIQGFLRGAGMSRRGDASGKEPRR